MSAQSVGVGRIALFMLLAVSTAAIWQGSRLAASLLAIKLHATPFAVGILIALYSLLPLVGSVWLGRTIDRMGARRPMMMAAAVQVVALLMPFAFETLPMLLLSATIIGAGFAVCQLSLLNAMVAASTPENRIANLSWVQAGFAAGSIVGPLVTGYVIDAFSHRIGFLLLVPFAATILIAIAIRRTATARRQQPAGPAKPVDPGKRKVIDLLRQPGLRDTFVVGATLSVSWDLFGFIVPVYGSGNGLSASVIGVILSCFAGASFAVRIFIPIIVRHFRDWTLVTAAVFATALVYTLFPLATGAYSWMVLASVLGMMNGIGQPVNQGQIYAVAPEGRGGEAMGVRIGLGHGMHIIAPLSIGALSTRFGMAPVVWAISLWFYYAAWFALVRARRGAQ